jgi:hypothetical protein
MRHVGRSDEPDSEAIATADTGDHCGAVRGAVDRELVTRPVSDAHNAEPDDIQANSTP